jgi:hypothetical protein
VTVPKCNGGTSTAESDVGILKEKIGGCNWKMHCDIQRERLHASVDNIPEGRLLRYDE